MSETRCEFVPFAGPDESGRRKWQCKRCSQQTGWTQYSADRIFAQCEGREGWGDKLARWLRSFGFKPCAACERRKRLLNRLSDWLR